MASLFEMAGPELTKKRAVFGNIYKHSKANIECEAYCTVLTS